VSAPVAISDTGMLLSARTSISGRFMSILLSGPHKRAAAIERLGWREKALGEGNGMAGNWKDLGIEAGMRVRVKHTVPTKTGRTEYLQFNIDQPQTRMGQHLKVGAWRQMRVLAYPGTVKVTFTRPM
jgi:hypothetical protein